MAIVTFLEFFYETHLSPLFIYFYRSYHIVSYNSYEVYYLQRAFCAYCHDRIWGLGRQGFKCTQCKLLIHKKCHKLIKVGCDVEKVNQLTSGFEGRGTSGTDFLRHGNGAVPEIMGKF